MELIHKKIFTTSKIGLYQSFFLKFLILYGHRVKTEKVRHIIFSGPVIINNGASDRRLARIRTK